ncbi:sulfite exporter TauE/SafE family protein [Janibacter alittae]|uniref:Probable membrane transporter protein n=1 Tax=Janibacter alittae TaxID=3115209 RepID=A0ABZ2MKW9_9MICO
MSTVLLVVIGAVILGITLQRTSGMGTGLVLSPTLTLAIGPVTGILLTNATTVAAAVVLTYAVRTDIDWGRYVRVAPTIVAGSVPAALLVYATGSGWLEVIIGATLLLSLAASSLLPPLGQVPPLVAGLVAGFVGGFLNTAVGVAAAVMLVYAQVTRWEQRPFAATLQPIFLTMGVASVVTKLLVGASDTSQLPSWPLIAATVGTVPVGVLVGTWVSRRVSAATARRVAVVLVVIGSSATLVRGLSQVISG